MTTKRVTGMLLVAILATVAATVVSLLALQEADAGFVTVKTCGGGTIKLTNAEGRVLKLHNQTRTARGLRALCVHPALTEAARAHSQEMLEKDYMEHNSFNGESVKHRLERFGYNFSGYSYYWYGENIACGCGSRDSPDSIFKGWMRSRGHRSNILHKKYREVGVGVRGGTYRTCNNATTYTVDFAARRR
jgi:uncharacterized protein YkwD